MVEYWSIFEPTLQRKLDENSAELKTVVPPRKARSPKKKQRGK
jgi:hypothetical protein